VRYGENKNAKSGKIEILQRGNQGSNQGARGLKTTHFQRSFRCQKERPNWIKIDGVKSQKLRKLRGMRGFWGGQGHGGLE